MALKFIKVIREPVVCKDILKTNNENIFHYTTLAAYVLYMHIGLYSR